MTKWVVTGKNSLEKLFWTVDFGQLSFVGHKILLLRSLKMFTLPIQGLNSKRYKKKISLVVLGFVLACHTHTHNIGC